MKFRLSHKLDKLYGCTESKDPGSILSSDIPFGKKTNFLRVTH